MVTYAHRSMSEVDDGIDPVPASPKPPCVVVDRTLAIIKPDAIDRAEEIIEDIVSNGFMILQVVLMRDIEFQHVLGLFWFSSEED